MSGLIKFSILQANVVLNAGKKYDSSIYSDTKEGRNRAFQDSILDLKNKEEVWQRGKGKYVLLFQKYITSEILHFHLIEKEALLLYKHNETELEHTNIFINLEYQQIAVQISSKNQSIKKLLVVL